MNAGYSGTPLPKKLGVKEGAKVAWLNAPWSFKELLGELPPGVRVQTRLGRGSTCWCSSRPSAPSCGGGCRG